jgi:hypothetical protein
MTKKEFWGSTFREIFALLDTENELSKEPPKKEANIDEVL